MRILIFSTYFYPEGGAASERMTALAKYLSRRGNRVEVIAPLPSYPEGEVFPEYRGRTWVREEIEGVEVLRVPTFVSRNRSPAGRTAGYLSFTITGAFRGSTRAADVLIGTTGPLFTPLIPLILSRFRGTPFILDLRDLWPERITVSTGMRTPLLFEGLNLIEKSLYRGAGRIVVVSSYLMRRLLEKGVPEWKIEVVTNGADLEIYHSGGGGETRDELRIPRNTFLVVYTGGMGLLQDGETILKCAGLLRSDPGIHFLLAGGGVREKRWKERAEELGLGNVTFLPYSSSRKASRLIEAGDVGINANSPDPHNDMALPVKMFSYMACGRPVVLANNGEARELLERGGFGIAVRPGDYTSLARAIAKLKGDRTLCRTMGRRGLDLVRREFSREELAARYESIISETVKGEG